MLAQVMHAYQNMHESCSQVTLGFWVLHGLLSPQLTTANVCLIT